MSINFPHTPGNLRVPGTTVDFTSSGGSSQPNLRTLLIGQVLAGFALAAAGVAGVPEFCASVADIRQRAGAGSMLARMVARYRALDDIGEVWVLPLLDDPAAVAATGTLTITGLATAYGTLALYVAEQLVAVLASPGMTAVAMAASVAATVGGMPDLPVTAAAAAGVVTFTAKHKGLAGNDILLQLNYRGTAGGEALPAGLGATVTAMAGGTQNPALTLPLLNLADMAFEVITCPYTDPASLDAMDALMNPSTGRWAPTRKIYGHVYAARAANVSQATTFGPTRNGEHVSVLPIDATPLPPPLVAAEIAAAVISSVREDPARPLQYLRTNIPAPPPARRFNYSDRNVLLFDGLCTYKVIQGGIFELERMVTTNQVNAAGAPDISYLDCETMHTLAYGARDIDGYLMARFLARRVKLVADDVRIPGGVAMASPALIKAEMDTRYRYLCDPVAGPAVMQDPDGFARESRVELAGPGNPGRVRLYAPFRVAGQLRGMDILVDFSKPS